jgi:tetratricopeptide (TPR) repeat protein
MEAREVANSSPPSGWPWLGTLACIAIIAFAGIAAYQNSLRGEFMFDDEEWIIKNPSIRQLWPLGEVLFPADAERVGGRPVVSLTLALNYRFGELNVWGYHALNVAVHILAALVLFGVVLRTLLLPPPAVARAASPHTIRPCVVPRELKPTLFPTSSLLALAVALVWLVHPLQTEAVSYVIQRAESLVGLFYLLTLYAVIRGATISTNHRTSQWIWYFAAIVCCLLGMATKEVMASAPVVILLYDAIFLSGSFRRALAARWGLYLAMAATWSVLVWVLVSTNFHAETTGFSVPHFTPWTYFLTEPEVLINYLRLAIWPDSLCFAYDLAPATTPERIIGPGIAILGLLGLTGWALIKQPPIGFLGAAFFLILAPTSTFVPILDAAFEHRMYLPLAPLVALVVIGGYRLWPRFAAQSKAMKPAHRAVLTAGPPILLLAAIAGLTWTTIQRNRVYESAFNIWQDTVDKRPENSRAHYNLALALSAHGRSADAMAEYRLATETGPDRAEAYQNWGGELALQGKLDEAIPLFERAIAIRPEYAEAHFNLALALTSNGQIDAAIRHYQDALKSKSDYPEAHSNLGHLLALEGKLAAAAAELQEAIRLQPDFAQAHTNLAGILTQQRKPEQAAVHARRALEIDPRSADAHYNLGGALVLQGKIDAAIAEYERALAIEPKSATFLADLGSALLAKHDARAAVNQWREAVRLDPNRPDMLNQLAWALATNSDDSLRDGAAAIELARRASKLTGGKNPVILATWAAAEAEAGRFPQAVELAERAADLAEGHPEQAEFLAALREQIKLYESGFPLRQPPRP